MTCHTWPRAVSRSIEGVLLSSHSLPAELQYLREAIARPVDGGFPHVCLDGVLRASTD